jgi:RNA polymerase sigma-70 factor, ECF subfamily
MTLPAPGAAHHPNFDAAANSGEVTHRIGDVSTRDLRLASDAQLVVAIGRFRHDALAEVYRRHAPAAFGLARRIVADRALAEEVVQEVFLRLWNVPDRFDAARGSLRTYLLTQTHGRSVDVIRAEASRRAREERDARLTAEGGYDLEREVWDLTQAEHVRDALSLLTEGERKAIELAYFGGHTYREVAVLLDEPEGTVKSRIRSGLRRLRTVLVDTGIGAP